MATYAELYGLNSNTELRNRVAVAVAIKAQALIAAVSPTQNQLKWAQAALMDPVAVADILYRYVLAANNTATVAQIQAVSDATLQSSVGTAVDALIAGGLV